LLPKDKTANGVDKLDFGSFISICTPQLHQGVNLPKL